MLKTIITILLIESAALMFSLDKIEPNMAAVITPKYGKKIVTLMGTDPKYPKYIRAIDKAGNIFYIRKSNLYNLLTGRMP